MSIFGNKSVTEPTEIEAPVVEGYSLEVGGDLMALSESFDDANEIMEAFYAIEMGKIQHKRAVQESTYVEDEESVTEAASDAVKNGAEKIKKFFMNLWAKLTAFFKSVVAYFDAFTKTGESFAKKYESKVKVSSVKIKAHKYTNLEAGFDKDSLPSELESMVSRAVATAEANSKEDAEQLREIIKERKENRQKDIANYRADVVGSGGELTSDEFKSALFSFFRSGAKPKAEKDEITLSMGEVFKALKDKAPGKAAKDFKTAVDKEFKKALTQISKVEKSLKKSQTAKVGDKEYSVSKENVSVALEALRTFSSEFSARKDVQLTAFRVWRVAIAERQVAYRQAVVKALGKSEKTAEA